MAEQVPERKDIMPEDCWDLTPLFADESEWEKLFADIEASLKRYASFQGTLASSFERFREAVEFDTDISRKLDRLFTYAHLKSDEDKSEPHNMGLYQRAMNLYSKASEEASFITPEILDIPEDIINDFISNDAMKDYAFYFEQILRNRPHTLSREEEQLLAMGAETAQAPSFIFGQLDNADLTFGELEDSKGQTIELSHGSFSYFLNDPSPAVRRKAFLQYYEAYDKHKNTLAAALAYSNKKDVFYARARRFPSTLEAALFGSNVPVELYDNLIKTVRTNTAPLFKYLRFRQRTLGLEELHFCDTYVPIVPDMDFNMPFEEAAETCADALAPLGREYCEELKRGLLGGWVDRYENRGKRSGAYSSGCYDSPPYILTNYRADSINSLYTLIHEGGHSMHSLYSKRNQPYISHEYTIFAAEVASTFNETLLSRYLMKKYETDDRMKAYILNREIDNIRATLYRQTMFAEFEKITHEIIEAGNPLTLDVMRSEYEGLLKSYFGDTIVLDKALTLECLRIPHFYSAFYVYKYATGISAAIALAEKVLNGGEAARKSYLKFLGLGGSAFPIDELITAGVDMRTPEPIEKAIAHFSALVEKLEEACTVF